MRLGTDGAFHPYNVGVRTSGTKPTRDSLALQYARQDLAPSVPFLPDDEDLRYAGVPDGMTSYRYDGTEEAREHNRGVNIRYYDQVNDSIGKRVVSGYYDKYPEQYMRDIQMRNQYLLHPTSPAGWGCINSVEGLNGRTQWSNVDFVKNKRYEGRYTMVPFGKVTDKAYSNMKPGSIYQTPNFVHSVMYLGNQDGNHRADWYDTHGYPEPFKNGSQIEHTYWDATENIWNMFEHDKSPGYLFLKK